MQMQQLDKRIRKMLEILEDYCVIRTMPVDEILCTDHGRSEWKTFRNGSFWGENGQEWDAYTGSVCRGQSVLLCKRASSNVRQSLPLYHRSARSVL